MLKSDEERLIEAVNELLNAIRDLLGSQFYVPAMILLYCAIDFVASLDRPDSSKDATRQDFINWVEKYLIPGSNLKCNAIDLYAARCGWVHSYTAKARLVREQRAKEMELQFGVSDDEDKMQNAIKDKNRAVAVHFTRLFNAFSVGLDKWLEEFSKDHLHKQRVITHSAILMHSISRDRPI
jgi:hypothetical protein